MDLRWALAILIGLLGCDASDGDADGGPGDGAVADGEQPAPDSGPADADTADASIELDQGPPLDLGPAPDLGPEPPDQGREPDAAPPLDQGPAPDQGPLPDQGPPPECGDGVLDRGEACDGEPGCVECRWPACEVLAACRQSQLLPPQHEPQWWRARRSGDLLVVGNPTADIQGNRSAGRVHAFQEVDGDFVRVQALQSSAPARDAGFGGRIAIDGERLAIAEAGRVRLYVWDGAAWVPDGQVSGGDGFGESVALSNGRLAVGRSRASREAGAVSVFARTDAGWSPLPAPAPDDLQRGDRFGRSLDLDGDWLLVGADSASSAAPSAGAIYFFRFDGEAWSEGQRIDGPAVENLSFGRVLALSGEAAVVGTERLGDRRGGVTFLELRDGAWEVAAELQPPQVGPGALFGSAVAIEGDRAVVQARGDDGPQGVSGRVLIFDRGEAGWAMSGELSRPGSGSFGASLHLDDGVITVGVHGMWVRIGNITTYSGAVLTYR